MATTSAPAAPPPSSQRSSPLNVFGERGRLARFRDLALLPVLAIVFAIGCLVNSAFFTESNVINILQQSSELSVVVIAEALILLVGRFDLSLESIVGFAPMLAVFLVIPAAAGGSGAEIDPYLGLVLVLVLGAAVGAFNGALVVKLALNAFMVTLATLILLRGVTIGVSSGKTLYDLPAALTYLGTEEWLGIPVSVWLAAMLYLGIGAMLRYHGFGRAIYAVGGNQEAARAAGIRVERVILIVFVIGGMLAALAGLMLTGRLASVTSSQGQNMIFSVFAAAVIGGISLNGGRGTLLGALTGVLLLGMISNILTLSRIESFWIDAAFGAIILIALVLARFTAGETAED